MTAAWCLAARGIFAQDAAPQAAEFPPEEIQFYELQIRPLLEEHCYKCHGPQAESKGGLRLDSRGSILKGGDSGSAIDLERVDDSLLMQALNYDGYEMPPSGKLPEEKIALFRQWVAKGLPMPTQEVEPSHEATPAHGPPQVDEVTKQHWAFRPVVRPSLPQVDNLAWVNNPIDAFILAKLEAAGISPAPPADKQALIRRVTYDLTGLPPTPEEVDAFLADRSHDAYERLVDRLLDSPHYGEQAARYWLDLVRYAETNSFERDNPKPAVWRYRDYVIRSFNNDKPYDQFLREQLAGDEFDSVTPESLIATGYYRIGLWDDEPADPDLAFYDGLDDIAATTAQAFLGLTLNCARCHDHKLDPIPQVDYYRFVAFFRNIQHYGKRSDESVIEASVREVPLPEEATHYARLAEEYEHKRADLREQIRIVEEDVLSRLKGGERDDFQDASSRLDIIRRGVGRLIEADAFERYARNKQELAKLDSEPVKLLSQILSIKEHGPEAPATHVLIRGNPHVPGPEVTPGFPSVLSAPDPVIAPSPGGDSTGRRRALAEWITSRENPLTARVMANRVWSWHFGRGIVRTPNNFGLQGSTPTHPELLDWLAAEFVEQGWSLKSMHRLILLSNTYRQSLTSSAADADAENDLFSRFQMRRLRAEEVRDSILAVTGSLNRSKMFGPSIYPVIPDEVLAGQSRPGHGWGKSSEEDVNRRSIYIHIKRSLAVPILAAFDVADTEATCPVRFATTQPTQSLGMLNSEFLHEQAAEFADFLKANAGEEPSSQVRMALQRALQREPTEQDVARGLALMQSLQSDFQFSDEDSLRYFCLSALNLNEFLYLD